MKRLACLLPLLILILLLPACSPGGMAMDTGATLGIASQTDGGLGGSARDFAIKVHINDLWFRYDLETFARLNLSVNKGRVLITGAVEKPEQRVEAVRLAWQAPGVRQVINEIRVAHSGGFPGYIHDEWITARLRMTLTFDADVYSINYSIDTVQRVVYIMGVAGSQAELYHVLEIARGVPGVRQVVSYISLSGQAVPPEGTAIVTTTRTTTMTKTTHTRRSR